MKINKTQAVLFIFEQLLKHKQISKSDVQAIINISDLAFRRYIQELRAYLVNFNEDYEIIYSRRDDLYLLKTNCR